MPSSRAGGGWQVRRRRARLQSLPGGEIAGKGFQKPPQFAASQDSAPCSLCRTTAAGLVFVG